MTGKFNIVNFDDTVELDNETENLYELTEYQAFLLLTQTEYLGWKTRWDNLPESTDILAIRDLINYKLMTPLNGDEIIVTTPTDLCEAVECGIINVMARAVAGGAGNTGFQVTLDDDGVPTITDGDLATGSSGATITSNRVRMADMEYIELRLEDLLNDFDEFYTSTGGDVTIMEQFMTAKYLCNATITSVIAEYKAFRDTPNPHIVAVLDNLDRVMYCKGATKQVVSSWIIDDVIAHKSLRLNMVGVITDEQFEQWKTEIDSLSDDYISTACFKAPQVTMVFPASSVAPLLKDTLNPPELALFANTRANIRFSGLITASNGETFDGLYLNKSGTKTYRPVQITSGGQVSPTPAYSTNGYEMIWNIGASISRIRFDAGLTNGLTYSGELTLIFDDIGQVV